jgi:hypothetical protein
VAQVDDLSRRARRLAADLLEASADDVVQVVHSSHHVGSFQASRRITDPAPWACPVSVDTLDDICHGFALSLDESRWGSLVCGIPYRVVESDLGLMRRHLAVLAGMLALTTPAAGSDVGPRLSVRGGALRISSLDIKGANRIVVTVTDARATGEGWMLSATPQLRRARATVVAAATIRCAAGSTCTLPQTNARYPFVLATTGSTPILAAARRSGMGAVSVTVRFAAPLRETGVPTFALRRG